MKLILISMAWWINRTIVIGLLKIRENCMQNYCITQKWQSGVLLVKLLSLVLTFLMTIMEMLWLRTLSAITILCLFDMRFQQNGATAHTSMDVLRPLFSDCLISRFTDTSWPSWSPDLSIWDYFLWGYLKAPLYEHKPHILEDLTEAICTKVVQIDRAILERVKANFQERLQKCIDQNRQTWRILFSKLKFVKC